MKQNFLFRGIACIVIGLAVLLAPGFLKSPGLQEAVGGSSLVGWFAVVLGVALVAVHLLRRPRKR
ncbi:hypothetical protein GT347_00585 [Xylophilus rhododendri]|uniref:Uncharacterized protein n=1 Tax=Xylophilus rhododendri TaxID=2697032 RepID=A0A857IYJ7_9BURK|nr:hypothetical protein [Xylophilus rhododendri]QHI96624.1 hypothetical protein GT347_00585 [Xylophilus rhododendri]